MKKTKYRRGVVLLLAVSLSVVSHAKDATEPVAESAALPPDVVLLKNGSKILGTVISARDGVIVVETDFAGTLNIDSAEVESVETQGSLVVQMADGIIIRDQPIVFDEEGMEVTSDTGDERSYTMSDIRLINPEPWELGEGYKAVGLVSFAWVVERGNTDTDELDIKVESFWRSLEDRYTLKANSELDKANGVKNADNWRIIGKYDRFLDGPNYWGGNVALEQDLFADLDLRAYIGPYYGRQFYDKPVLRLSGELGLSFVAEKFITAENQKYPGANWNIGISSNYLGGNSRLYLDHVGIWNLKDTSDVILNTTFGLAIPLLGSLEAAAEIKLEFDSGAVEGVEELDQTYSVRLGYTW
jgi:putative salt-induced outer membrane protein YdiY